ncbi:MAG: phosphoribosylformylglycinamidine synthase subunit PurL [Candidatus Firestonebacteria bacterium]
MKNVKIINILKADDKKLLDISKKGLLSLNLDEMKTVQRYFKKKKRNPTDVELETIAQTWSEHCKHKSFRGIINYNGKIIDNLLKQTVIKVTKELNKKWCVSVFEDNAGIIKFDDNFNIAFKVETHNHPSAIEPYGGAGTGIGGVIRDILGVGLGGKPILNTDIFCFGPLDFSHNKLIEGILHPKRVFKGVVSGVRDYGNRMGIPTANGTVIFEEGYVCNPLVYCGTVGIIPKDKCFKKVKNGDIIVSLGGKTGRDGIHGATFSSIALDKDTEVSAVQIGNPIVEKKVLDVLLQARDKNLYTAITDCGAGGYSSAVGEMGEKTGAKVYLERIPLKYEGLSPWEIWVSEAQERMVFAVPIKNLHSIMKIFESENVPATIIGEFTDTKKLELFYGKSKVADLDMDFVHNGGPRFKLNAIWKEKNNEELSIDCPSNLGDSLNKILSDLTVCSKEWIIRQYDHEVQGGSIIKPLQGVTNDGPGDACIVRPILNSNKGVIVANGINPRYGMIDPYWMAASNIDEAIRNIVAVGGDIDKIALLDNFCWGNPHKPEQMAGLVRAALACYDLAKNYGTPFISGKDSLNNEYMDYNTGKKISIPGTLLISSICVMEDIRTAGTMDFKEDENLIYIIGKTFNELGGSIYCKLFGQIGNFVPKVNAKLGKKIFKKVHDVIKNKIIRSCHDCSEGGIGVALAEMCFSGGLGAEIYLNKVSKEDNLNRDDFLLFSESNTRFIVEVEKRNKLKFEKMFKDIPVANIGKIKNTKRLVIYGLNSNVILNEDINKLKESWQSPLKNP